MISNSRNKFHQTTYKEIFSALYKSICNFPLFNRSKGSSIIPEVGYHEIEANGGRFTEANAELIRKRGCVIVRGMLPKEEAGEMKSELMEYLSTNNVNVTHVDASPIKDVFWSKAQVYVRRMRIIRKDSLTSGDSG